MPKKQRRSPPQQTEGFEFEILAAREMNPREGSMVLVLGPPGTSKSTFLSSMCVEGETLLIATLNREASSWGYQDQNPDTILLTDKTWRPTQGRFETDAYLRFLDLMDRLAEDDHYKVVLLDSGTELGEFGWREALKGFGVASPAEMEDRDNRFRPYTRLADLMRQAMDGLLALREAPLPKIIGVSWHLQPTKEDAVVTVGSPEQRAKVKKPSADTRAEGIEYGGTVLPMLQGGFRRRIAGLADAVVYTDVLFDFPVKGGKRVASQGKQPIYVVQVVPDEERHAKIPGPLPNAAKLLHGKYLDHTNINGWELLKALMPKVR